MCHQNVPTGWGEPIFGKLQAELGKAMLNINACKGFEYGSGFCGAKMLGSEHNDLFNEDGTTKLTFQEEFREEFPMVWIFTLGLLLSLLPLFCVRRKALIKTVTL